MGIYVIGFAATGGDLFIYKFWAPKYENAHVLSGTWTKMPQPEPNGLFMPPGKGDAVTPEDRTSVRELLRMVMELFNGSSETLTDSEYETAIQIGRLLREYRYMDAAERGR